MYCSGKIIQEKNVEVLLTLSFYEVSERQVK